VVTLGSAGFGLDGHSVVFTARSYVPASFTPNVRIKAPGRCWHLIVSLDATQRVRVFAGQVDPDRSDHFTIGFEINGKRGTIDGWLRDKNWAKAQDYRTWSMSDECVELRVREGPGKWFENRSLRLPEGQKHKGTEKSPATNAIPTVLKGKERGRS
jgi:hypothetical protein